MSSNQPPNADVNPPNLGGDQPGAPSDPVRDRRPDPQRGDHGFESRAPNPAGRTALALVAQRLVADQTASPGQVNREPLLNMVLIHATRLRQVFQFILYPLVYGNYRSIGTRTCTTIEDTNLLNNVITTISVNATFAAYAVMYNKASAINTAGTIARFGGIPEVDTFRYPALITLLVNSIGPVERDRDPYRCQFIPYMQKASVDALRTLPGYFPLLEVTFTTGILRTRNILVTEVDVNSRDSSHWWMLYVNRQNNTPHIDDYKSIEGHTTVYSPVSFEDRDTAVLIGGLCIIETLYDLPGPLRTAKIGPYISPRGANSYQSIPMNLRNNVAINNHPPVMLITIEESEVELTHAQVHVFGQVQNDDTLRDTAANSFARIRTNVNRYNAAWQNFIDALLEPGETSKKRSSPPTQPEQIEHVDPDGEADQANNYTMKYATIIYCDHVMYDRVPFSRIGTTITEASRMDARN